RAAREGNLAGMISQRLGSLGEEYLRNAGAREERDEHRCLLERKTGKAQRPIRRLLKLLLQLFKKGFHINSRLAAGAPKPRPFPAQRPRTAEERRRRAKGAGSSRPELDKPRTRRCCACAGNAKAQRSPTFPLRRKPRCRGSAVRRWDDPRPARNASARRGPRRWGPGSAAETRKPPRLRA